MIGDWIYELPRLENANALIKHALGGWEVAGIFIARTGERLIITQVCASNWHCRPDYAGGPTVIDNWQDANTTRCIVGARCSVQYLNRNAFQLVPVNSTSQIAVRPGNLGNGAVRGPGSWSADVSLSKNFRLRETLALQVRADMFNFLNKVNLSGPSTGLNGATFGEINGAGGMRVIQLNGRLRW